MVYTKRNRVANIIYAWTDAEPARIALSIPSIATCSLTLILETERSPWSSPPQVSSYYCQKPSQLAGVKIICIFECHRSHQMPIFIRSSHFMFTVHLSHFVGMTCATNATYHCPSCKCSVVVTLCFKGCPFILRSQRLHR